MTNYVKRKLESRILKHFQEDRVPFHTVLLGGARQCGKSTMLLALFPPEMHLHINLAKESGFCEAIEQTSSFDDFTVLLESRFHYRVGDPRVLIIDEAQLSKRLGRYVRFFKEVWRTQRVILTGSTLSDLFDANEKPTGRVVEFILRPFNFIEFLKAIQQEGLAERVEQWSIERPFSEAVHREVLAHLTHYLETGGLPEVAIAYRDKRDWMHILANIFAFYKRDFESNAKQDHLSAIFAQVFLRIAASTGSPIGFSSIIKSSSPGYKKVKDVIATLESWHQILSVICETAECSKVGTLTPKRYIFDHGIRFLQNPARFQDLDLLDTTHLRRQELGGVIENFVLTELVSLHNPLPIRAWSKTHQSGHVDYVWNEGGQTTAIEVKSTTHFNQKYLSAFLAFKRDFPKSACVLANLDRGGVFAHPELGKIPHIPVYAVYAFLKT